MYIYMYTYLILQDYIHHWISLIYIYIYFTSTCNTKWYTNPWPTLQFFFVMCWYITCRVKQNSHTEPMVAHTERHCWWTKSCTTTDDDYPTIHMGFNHPRWLFGILSIHGMTFQWQHGIHLGVAQFLAGGDPPAFATTIDVLAVKVGSFWGSMMFQLIGSRCSL